MKQMLMAALLSFVSTAAFADQLFWCPDEASSGYIMDPRRAVGDDKSKPQSFIRSRVAVRLSEQKAFLNFQGLGETEFSCSAAREDVIQCVGPLRLFVFDQKLHRFNLAQLDGHVAGSIDSLVLRFGECKAVDRLR